MGHARAVAAATDPTALTREIISRGLSVRAAEERARRGRTSAPHHTPAGPGATDSDPDRAALERQLGDLLGLRVQVQHKEQGGTVTLHYSSLDQLDMICQRLSGEPI